KDEDEEMINAKVDDYDKGFGDQFLKLSFDSSLVSTVKDTTYTEINSLLEVKIQSEVPHTQSSSVLIVLVYVIFKPIVITPVQESPSTTTATTLPPPSVTTTPSVPQQTTPIPIQPIITDAPTITTVVPEFNALTAIELRVAKLEKDVFELKIIDYSTEALAILKSQVPSVVDWIQTLIEDENAMDKGVTDIVKDHKRNHDDDEDPPARPNQGKKTKRRRTKDSESSKKPSSTKKTSKGKAPTKGSKTGKSTSAKEPVEEPIAEVVMDDVGDDVTYTSSITKTKAAWYEIKGLEDMVPTLWSTIKHAYDKDAEKGIKHWGDFVDLHPNDIKDMLLLAVQHKLFHLDGSVIVDFIVALQIEFKEPYTPSYDPPGIVYEDLDKQKRFLRAGELYKFSDGTLKSVRDEIHHRVLDFRLDYNTKIPKRKWMVVD
ncbi:hypothetical protein Tco_0128533, partial [Tanacetum coccineum]